MESAKAIVEPSQAFALLGSGSTTNLTIFVDPFTSSYIRPVDVVLLGALRLEAVSYHNLLYLDRRSDVNVIGFFQCLHEYGGASEMDQAFPAGPVTSRFNNLFRGAFPFFSILTRSVAII